MPRRNQIDELAARIAATLEEKFHEELSAALDNLFFNAVNQTQAPQPRQKPTAKQAKPKVAEPTPKPRAPKAQTLYAILGVDPSCESEIIEAAWKAQCRKWHPDIAGPKGEDRIKAVNTAHDVLCDPVARREYDRKLREGENGR